MNTYVGVNEVPVLVESILPCPEPHAFHDCQDARSLAWRGFALKLFRLHQLRLYAEHGLFHPAGLDDAARRRMQPSQRPLRSPVRRVDRGGVCSLDKVLGNDVDTAFTSVGEVAQRVLGAVETAGVPKDEDGRVVVDELEVGEWRQVRALAWFIHQLPYTAGLGLLRGAHTVLADRAAESYRSRYDCADQQLVIVSWWSPLFIWIDLYVVLFQTRAPVIASLAILPVWVSCLCPRLLPIGPVLSGCLDFLEVGMGVSLHDPFRIRAWLICHGASLEWQSSPVVQKFGFPEIRVLSTQIDGCSTRTQHQDGASKFGGPSSARKKIQDIAV